MIGAVIGLMDAANCWEMKHCGREPGGKHAARLGICPAAVDVTSRGPNRGRGGGRICWAIAGTYCGGVVQGTFAVKKATCMSCKVFTRVQEEEGAAFEVLPPGKTTHHALFEQFTSLMSIVDSINALVYVADLDTHELLFLNPYGVKLFGDDLHGKPCFEALHGCAQPCEFCTNSRLLVNGEAAAPVVWEFQHPVTQRWYLCNDRAIRWWDGRWVRMEIALDVTDRKQAELAHEQCLHLISHDLRNPLNALMLRAQVLQRALQKKGLTDEQAALGGLLDDARKMNGLIGELLESSRLDGPGLSLNRSELDLGQWVAQAVRASPPPSRTRLQVASANEPLPVSVDPAQLERVLQNLVSNALKYSVDRTVAITVVREGGEAIVTVSDQGVGVPAEELPHLFQRFYRASTAGKVHGLGLGLYSARLVVEAHGGRIWAESQVGEGSRFHFALPLA